MKAIKLRFILPSLMLLAISPLSSMAAEVKVEFLEAKKFSDYELSGDSPKRSLKKVKKDVVSLFSDLSKENLKDGYQLNIKVKNIDLPGNIRYGMGQTSQNIRVIDNTTLFRLYFDYELKNSAGETIKQGEHRLKEYTDRQPSTLQKRNHSALSYFERPLEKWMKETLLD